MIALKKPLTYKEQIVRLKEEHSLIIPDDRRAEEILRQVNYYRLSAYGIGLKRSDDREKFRDGVTIEHIYRLYTFDSKLRGILFHAIEQIEVQFRAHISNRLALEYGAEGYMDPENFIDKPFKRGGTIHEKLKDDFEQECKRRENIPFVRHHNDKYEGRFPIWVAVELFTFGNLSSIYKIMKPEDRKAVAAVYDTDPDHLSSWILSLVELRNICAHYGRVYNMPLKQAPALYRENRKYRSGSINRLFPVLLATKRIFCSDERWKNTTAELEALLDEYRDVVNLSFIGFPPNWRDVL